MAEFFEQGAPSPLDDGVSAVTRAVLTASRLLVAITARSLASVEDSVTLPQLRLMVVLATRGDAKLVALADRLGVNPSTVMRMADRLTAAGLLSRKPNPEDRRENLLSLTAAGQRTVDEVTARRRDEVAAIVGRMAPEQRSALVAALTAFSEAGQEISVPEESHGLYPLGWGELPSRPAARSARSPS